MEATVIINSYKEKPEYLIQTIEAFIKQMGVDMQIIISTVFDDPNYTNAKVRSYMTHRNIDICVSNKPGIYYQLNNAMKMVKGDWITYTSSNDVPMPDKIISEIQACEELNMKVCYSAIMVTDENLNVLSTRRFPVYNIEGHLEGNYVTDGATFHRSLLKYLPFQWEKWGNHAYYDFWLRVYEAEGNVFVYNDKPTFLYRQTQDSKHIKRQKDREKYLANKKLMVELQDYHKSVIIKQLEDQLHGKR